MILLTERGGDNWAREMDTNQIEIDKLVEDLHGTLSFACRVFLDRADGDWRLVTMVADGLDSQDSVPSLVYDYER
jgi:hypothetical protein